MTEYSPAKTGEFPRIYPNFQNGVKRNANEYVFQQNEISKPGRKQYILLSLENILRLQLSYSGRDHCPFHFHRMHVNAWRFRKMLNLESVFAKFRSPF